MLVIGAKGLAKELLDLLAQNELDKDLVFFDDLDIGVPSTLFGQFDVLQTEKQVERYFDRGDRRFVLGLGNPDLRYAMCAKFRKLGGQMISLTSPTANIGRFGNTLEEGTTVLTNVVIECNNRISEGTFLHVAAFISHDTVIGKFCEISPYAKLLGGVQIGDFCSLGAGCVILPKLILGDRVVVGAGAVVTKDVASGSIVMGIPAAPRRTTDHQSQ